MFHDSNVTPLNNNTAYVRLNNTSGVAIGNPRGVTQALKEFLNLDFDESRYINQVCAHNGSSWRIIHYPFCNGLTVLTYLGSLVQ
jgi:hypothetical protein